MRKVLEEIIKKLSQTAAGKKMTPKQLEARAKVDYKDAQDYKAKIAREDKSFINQVNRELKAEANPKDPKNRAMLNAKEREAEKYIPGYKGKTYKKGGSVKKGYHKMPDGSVMKNSAHKMSCGGKVHKMKAGGKVRGDGICKKGKTRGRMV